MTAWSRPASTQPRGTRGRGATPGARATRGSAMTSIDDVVRFCCSTIKDAADVEVDEEARHRADVDDLTDRAQGAVLVGAEAPWTGPRSGSSRAGPRRRRPCRAATGPLSPRSRFDVPTKPATNGRRRTLVDLGGAPDLLDPPGVEHRDPVGHRERFLLVVGHEDERDPDLALDALELDLHLLAQLEVQRAERLVEQQHLGPVHQGAGQGDPLALAAGQLAPACGCRTARAARSPAPRQPGCGVRSCRPP